MMSDVTPISAQRDSPSARTDLAGGMLTRLQPQPVLADVVLHRSARADRPLRQLLVAIGGTSSPDSLVQVATALVALHGAAVDVVSVYEPRIPYPAAPSRHALRRLEEHDRPAAEEQLARVRATLRAIAGDDQDAAQWPTHLAIGQAAATIARLAQEQGGGADVIVMGRGHQVGDEPWLYDRTALRTALVSAIPILSVSDTTLPPRRLLVLTGLDALSLRVATTARRLFPDVAEVELLHVRRDDRTTDDEVLAHFRRLEMALGLPAERVRHTVLTGNPVEMVPAHIRATQPQCVAVGLYGATVTERAADENVALHLIERGTTNLLVVPA